jgi:hypothetical protein
MKVTATIFYGSSAYTLSDLPACDWSQPLPALTVFWLEHMAKHAGGYLGSMAQRVSASRTETGDMVTLCGNGWHVSMVTPAFTERINSMEVATLAAECIEMKQKGYHPTQAELLALL